MVWGNVRLRAAAAAGAIIATGCTQTSQVDENLTTAALSQTKKAVAVMRVGAAAPTCINVAVLLGVREGEGFRRHQGLTVMNVRSLTEPAVAEVELDPGEYHVIAYRCQTAKSVKTLADSADPGIYRTSFASFVVYAGEIVNVGYLRVNAARVGRSSFGRPVEATISVTDWPLAELDRFKAKRPQIYAQMKTRLMQVAAAGKGRAGSPDCARLEDPQGRRQGADASP